MNKSAIISMLLALTISACTDSGTSSSSTSSSTSSITAEAKLTWHSLTKGTFGFGSGSPKVVILFDPMCPHCAELKANLDRAPGPLDVKWVPIAALSSMSLDYGARIISSEDPVSAFTNHEQQVIDGRVPALATSVSAEDVAKGEDKVKANTAIFTKLEQTSIPVLVTVDKNNNFVIETGSKSLPAFMDFYSKFEK